jgi:hypothetical protein
MRETGEHPYSVASLGEGEEVDVGRGVDWLSQ